MRSVLRDRFNCAYVLRAGLSSVILFDMFLLRSHVLDIGGARGVIQPIVGDGFAESFTPRIAWFTGTDPQPNTYNVALAVNYLLVCASALVNISGLVPRLSAPMLLLSFAFFKGSLSSSIYGAHEFIAIGLFYSVLLEMSRGVNARVGRAGAALLCTWALRAHLCLAYGLSGIEKGSGSQWWSGQAMWRALYRTDESQMRVAGVLWLSEVPVFLVLGGISVIALESLYPVLAVWPRSRKAFVIVIVLMHLSIGAFLGLWVFAGAMVVLNVSAFLVLPGFGKVSSAEAVHQDAGAFGGCTATGGPSDPGASSGLANAAEAGEGRQL